MIAIVGMAAETNRLVTASGVAADGAFLVDPSKGALVRPRGARAPPTL
jgi:hypothetical protein